MATYTAVIVVPDELDQEYVQQQLERLGVLMFYGPGVLVSEDVVADEPVGGRDASS